MKAKYEISVWSDIYDNNLGRFKEQKEIIIGSDTMTSEARARNPKLVNNINGTNQFTFDMYYRYIDTQTGEEIENPYIKYLVNERKIKVLWKGEWYDLLIKTIKENQSGRVISYTCEDCYITELSRTGFELEFSTELQNNIGTAKELVEKVIENTDWQYDEQNSDTIYQLTEEAVYETQALCNFSAIECPSNNSINIYYQDKLLIYYSCTPDINNLKNNIQFYYAGSEDWQCDENDMLVINGKCCNITVNWAINEANSNEHIAIAYIIINSEQINLFSINFDNGISTSYRAERYVQSQKTVYNAIVNRYVNVYNNGTLYGYNTTEYNDALAVINLVTNPSNFKNTTGWRRPEGDDSKLYYKLSPGFDQSTSIASYTSTSFLYVSGGNTHYTFNSGILNNKSYLQNGFIEGERYIFRIKAKKDGEEPYKTDYINDYTKITPLIVGHSNYIPNLGKQYFRIVGESFYDAETNWLEYSMECIKSCPYSMISSTSSPFGIFLYSEISYWIEEVQFYREVFGTINDVDQIRIDPGSLSIQSIAQQYWKYFDAEQLSSVTKDTLEYVHISLDEWSSAIPDYNEYQRYGAIEADNSNRFNILQSIAETFQCWVRFYIKHDPDTGYIEYKDDLPCKYIQLKVETGEETGVGFIYGIDLKDITRNIKSDQISTKTIVEQNENEFGKNGFCSIARSEQNFPKENFIYNFDYYIQQGLLDKNVLYNDLYYVNGYYSELHRLNTNYANNLASLTNKKSEKTKQDAMAIVYNQYILAAEDEINSIQESIMKLAGVTNWLDAVAYANSHYRDTKVQSLANTLTQTQTTRDVYRALNNELESSLIALNTAINDLESTQKTIINDLRILNQHFYKKYSRFIQEGTWTSEDYWDDDLYYLDALQVAYDSSRPQISYEINVLRLSELEEYNSKQFKLGDIDYIQDVKYFGYKDDGITPYKEKVILTEITSYFDTPDKDVIKVQNYKTQFDDLFQRITASVQNLEFTQGKYAKAANIMTSDGTIRSSVIQNTFNENKDLVYGAQNESATIDNTGITVTDNGNAAKQVKVTSGGVFVTDDGGTTWRNAIRGDGISTDLLTAGRINTENITVYNGEYPSFRWDPNGLNAYNFSIDGVNTRQFVRFDQFGLYGMQLNQQEDAVFKPTDATQIKEKANFGLTWDGFFLKNSGSSSSIEISTTRDIVLTDENGSDRIIIGRIDYENHSSQYGMRICDGSSNVVFECGHFDTAQGYQDIATIAGWKFNNQYLESDAIGSNEQTIRIYADGNIGCYGREETRYPEYVYTCQVENPIDVIALNSTGPTTITTGTIYPFVGSVGSTKTQKVLDGNYDATEMTEARAILPTPSPNIQIAYTIDDQDYNYTTASIVWNCTLNTAACSHFTTSYGSTVEDMTYHTQYIYAWDLTAIVNDEAAFTLEYTENFDTFKNKYVPASKTKWSIDNSGDAIFHNIKADGGTIAGWFIDNEKIYQTTNNQPDGPIKTQLNSTGKAEKDGFDYSIITDAINAAIATLGGIILQNGRINGYDIGEIDQRARNAQYMAYNANTAAASAMTAASTLIQHRHTISGRGNAISFYDTSGVSHVMHDCPYYTDYTPS